MSSKWKHLHDIDATLETYNSYILMLEYYSNIIATNHKPNIWFVNFPDILVVSIDFNGWTISPAH